LRVWSRIFFSYPPNARTRMAVLRRVFPTGVFTLGLRQHDAAGDEHLIYAPDSAQKG